MKTIEILEKNAKSIIDERNGKIFRIMNTEDFRAVRVIDNSTQEELLIPEKDFDVPIHRTLMEVPTASLSVIREVGRKTVIEVYRYNNTKGGFMYRESVKITERRVR